MKSLLFSIFLIISLFSSFTQTFGMKHWKHFIQVHPQRETGLSDMPDEIIHQIVQSMIQEKDFQSLRQFSEVNHRMQNIAIAEFIKFTGANTSLNQCIELGIECKFPAVINAVINNILHATEENGPNGIKDIAKRHSVDNALRIAAQKGWILDLYLLLFDETLNAQITALGAKTAIELSATNNHPDCTRALMQNKKIYEQLDDLTIQVILALAITNVKNSILSNENTKLTKVILQNSNLFPQIPLSMLYSYMEDCTLPLDIRFLMESVTSARTGTTPLCCVQ